MATGELLVMQIVTEGFQKFFSDMGKADDRVSQAASGWEKSGGIIGKVAGTAFKAVALGAAAAAAAVGTAIFAIAKIGPVVIAAASDMSENMNKVNVVFKESAGAVTEFASTAAKNLGMSESAALSAAGTFGNLFTAMGLGRDDAAGMSTQILTLAADLASFNNLDPTEVLEKLRSGLVGETEPLRSLGVNLTDVAVRAKAVELGLASSTKEVDVAAMTQARLALIMEQTANAQGDFARTSGGMANQQRIFNAIMEDAKAKVGTAFLPLVENIMPLLSELAERVLPLVVTWVGNLAKKVEPLTEAFSYLLGTLSQSGLKRFFTTFEDGSSYLGNFFQMLGVGEEKARAFADVINSVVGFVGNIVTAFDTFKWALEVGLEPLDALKLALQTAFGPDTAAAVMGFIDGLKAAFEGARPFFEQFAATFQTVWGYIQTAVETIVPVVIQYIQMMMPVFEQWGAFISQVVQQVVAFVLPLIESMAAFFSEKIGFIVAWVQTNLPLIRATFETVLGAIKAIWEAVWPAIQVFVESVWTTIQTVISVAIEAVSAVITAVMQVIQGDWEAAWETIKAAAATIWETIKAGVTAFIDNVAQALGSSLEGIKATWKSNWDMLVTIVTAIWERIKTAIQTSISNIKESINGFVSDVTGAVDGIGGAIDKAIGWFEAMAQKIASIKLPDWMTPGSPTPLELGLLGIGKAMRELSMIELPQLQSSMQMGTIPTIGNRNGAGSSTVINNNNYNLTTNALTRPGGLALEFATMQMGSR